LKQETIGYGMEMNKQMHLQKQETLTLKGLETIFKPFLKFGQAIVEAIYIQNL